MAKAKLGDIVGAWAFLIGVILAVIIGLFYTSIGPGMALLLAVIGIIIGLLNIGDIEVNRFLLAGVSLVIVSKFGGEALVAAGAMAAGVFQALMIIFVPATVIVALKEVFTLSRT